MATKDGELFDVKSWDVTTTATEHPKI